MSKYENLISLSERSESERKEIARLGGIASGKARRRKKELKERMQIVADTNDSLVYISNILRGEVKETYKRNGDIIYTLPKIRDRISAAKYLIAYYDYLEMKNNISANK